MKIQKFFLTVGLGGIIASGLGVVACQEKKNLEEMHDATKKMEVKTSQLAETTFEMRDITIGLDKKTENMYLDLRKGDAKASRRSALKTMSEAKSFSNKVQEAVAYFFAFEFQSWSGLGGDNLALREELLNSAAREFMRTAQEFVNPQQLVPKTMPKIDLKQQNFNALSVALHFIDQKQHDLAKIHQIKPTSMLDLIEESLRLKKEVNEGKTSAPAYVREILDHEWVANLLMQARHNSMTLIFLGKTTNLDEKMMGAIPSLGSFVTWWQMNIGVPGKADRWSLDLTKANEVEHQDMLKYLKAANAAIGTLKSNQIQVQVDSDIRRIFARMDLKMNRDTKALEEISDKLLKELAIYLEQTKLPEPKEKSKDSTKALK